MNSHCQSTDCRQESTAATRRTDGEYFQRRRSKDSPVCLLSHRGLFDVMPGPMCHQQLGVGKNQHVWVPVYVCVAPHWCATRAARRTLFTCLVALCQLNQDEKETKKKDFHTRQNKLYQTWRAPNALSETFFLMHQHFFFFFFNGCERPTHFLCLFVFFTFLSWSSTNELVPCAWSS